MASKREESRTYEQAQRSRRTRDNDEKRRSRSPDNHRHQSHHKRSRSPRSKPVLLPYGARPLSKHDLEAHKPLLGLYLDIQKQIDIEELSRDEVKGRWKSFENKWNRGDLAEGWYDSSTKHKADQSAPAPLAHATISARQASQAQTLPAPALDGSNSEPEDDYGPSLPDQHVQSSRGPAVPRLEDLQHRNELAQEDEDARREDIRYARKQERKLQKDHLDELAPRAEPGTRERQMEKKREVGAANRSFREAKSPGAEEVREGELMGDDGAEGYKALLKAGERKKNERELRKEEIMRARAAERDEKMEGHRAKEQKTMEMLKALAKQRFG